MTDADRYHLTLVSDGRPLLHGWWASETVVRAKFTTWDGSHEGRADARITLTDKATSSVLTQWPAVGNRLPCCPDERPPVPPLARLRPHVPRPEEGAGGAC